MIQQYVVNIEPMGAPRMTRADSWRKRPVVLRYRAYKDTIRLACRDICKAPTRVKIMAYFTMPASWSRKKKADMPARLHQQKPDWDNVGKGVCDALWDDDSVIGAGSVEKQWTSGTPRIVIIVEGVGP